MNEGLVDAFAGCVAEGRNICLLQPGTHRFQILDLDRDVVNAGAAEHPDAIRTIASDGGNAAVRVAVIVVILGVIGWALRRGKGLGKTADLEGLALAQGSHASAGFAADQGSQQPEGALTCESASGPSLR